MPKAVHFAATFALAATSYAATLGDDNYNIKLWEPGKVPLASANGPLDEPFLTVFLPPAETEREQIRRFESLLAELYPATPAQ